jgi:hypothetical protein
MGLVACGAAPEESFDDTSNDSDEVKPGPGGAKIKGLALGDSIAFGMDPLVTTPQNPAAYKGYPDVINSVAGAAITVANAGCPGETSGSLLSATAVDNGCRQWKAAYSLHANYETTQIAFAESYIKANKDTKYVSIDVGANDLLILQRNCAGDVACINAGMPPLLAAYGQNLTATYQRVRAAGFTGKFVGLGVYAMNYNDALSVGALTALNGVLKQVTEANGGKYADGFAAFKNVAAKKNNDSCAAGLLIKLPNGTCDIHPSPAGRDLLAKTVVEAAK